MNSCKHGLRSESLTLPGEPPEWVRELSAEWNDHYQPQSPGRRALVDRAVLATIHHKRSRRYLTGKLGVQARKVQLQFNDRQYDMAQHFMGLLKTDPITAHRGLLRSAEGCRTLLAEWKSLEVELEPSGWWITPRREHAARLMGCRPEDPNDVQAFWVRYYNLAAREPRSEEIQAELTTPKSWPVTEAWPINGAPPTPKRSQEWLRGMVALRITELREHEEWLRTNFEDPDRASAEDEATLLDPKDMATWLRYERMHDSMFHRAYSALERREAPRPDSEPIPDDDATRSDDAATTPVTGSATAEAAAANAASALAVREPSGSRWVGSRAPNEAGGDGCAGGAGGRHRARRRGDARGGAGRRAEHGQRLGRRGSGCSG